MNMALATIHSSKALLTKMQIYSWLSERAAG